MRATFIGALSLGVALSAASSVCEAQPVGGRAKGPRDFRDRIAVLPVVSPRRAASGSDIHGAVSQAIRRRIGIELISAEEMFVANQEGLVDRVRDCGPDIPCIASRMRRFRARLGLVIVLDRTVSPAILGLQLIDTDLSRLMSRTLDELEAPGRALALIADRTRQLLDRAGYVEAGRLTVTVDPPAAQIRLGSGFEPDMGAPNVFTLRPGTYSVFAEHPGFAPKSVEVHVAQGAATEVHLALEEDTSVWESPWLWVAVGAVVVGAVVAGTVVATQPKPRVCISSEAFSCD